MKFIQRRRRKRVAGMEATLFYTIDNPITLEVVH